MFESIEAYSVLWLLVAIISIFPLVLFWVSYYRVHSQRLLITAIAFGIFFLKAAMLSLELFIANFEDDVALIIAAFVDTLFLGLVTAALLMKN